MRFAFLALALATPAVAQAPAEARSLGWFHGEWDGIATIFGRPAKVSMSVSPALNGTATALIYRAEVPPTTAQPVFRFEGRGIYRVGKDGQVSGQWADSQNNFHPLAGKVAGTRMTIDWGEPRTEIGRSTYTIGGDGKLTVTDAELSGDGLRVFATGNYTRRP